MRNFLVIFLGTFLSSPFVWGGKNTSMCDLHYALLGKTLEQKQDLLLILAGSANPKPLGKSQLLDNRAFIQKVDRGSDPNTYYLHLSLKVMKELNDRVFAGEESQGKEGVNAVRNLFRIILTEKLRENPEIWRHITGQYVDFKSMEFSFDKTTMKDPEVFEKQLFGAIRDAQIEFEASILSFFDHKPENMAAFLQEHGIVSDLRAWHTFGFAQGHPDLAAVAARFAPARFNRELSTPINPVKFSEVDSAKLVGELETVRTSLERTLGDSEVMAVHEGSGAKVLSFPAIDILRKIKASNLDEYVKNVQKEFSTALKISLTREQAIQLRDYFALSDRFQPNIRSEKRTEIRLTGGAHGIQSVDFAGQNIHNFHQTMGAVATAYANRGKSPSIGENAVIQSRKNEAIATRRLRKLNGDFETSRSKTGFKGEYQLSGDDGIIVLSEPVTGENHLSLYRGLLQSSQISDFRMVYLEAPAKVEQRNDPSFLSNQIVQGESLEKSFRKSLIGDYSLTELAEVAFPVHINPNTKTIEIFVAGKLPKDSLQIIAAKAKTFTPPKGYSITKVGIISP